MRSKKIPARETSKCWHPLTDAHVCVLDHAAAQPAGGFSGVDTPTTIELPKQVALDDEKLLPEVRFTDPDVLRKQASALDQCIILTTGVGQDLGQAQEEALIQEQLRAFARFGCAQPHSLWCLRHTALWLRSKIETGRHR